MHSFKHKIFTLSGLICFQFLVFNLYAQDVVVFSGDEINSLPEIGHVKVWKRGGNSNFFLCRDIDGDGTHEIIINEGDVSKTESDIKIYTPGQHYIDVQGIDYKLLTMITHDINGDSIPEMISIGQKGYQLFLYLYSLKNSNIKLRQSMLLARGHEIRRDGIWDMHIPKIYAVPGKPDKLIVTVAAGYDLEPRGLYQIDLQSMDIDWNLAMGSPPHLLEFTGTNSDGESEILLGTYSPDNGYDHNGLSDTSAYLLHISPQGKILNQTVITGRLGNASVKKVKAGPEKSQFYIIGASNAADAGRSTYIQIRDCQTLRILHQTRNTKTLSNFSSGAFLNFFHIEGYQIPLVRRSYHILRLNDIYEVERQYYFKNLANQMFMADLNSDMKPEFLVNAVQSPALVITDQNMRLLGKQNFRLVKHPNIEIIQDEHLGQTTVYFVHENNLHEWIIPFEALHPPSFLMIFLKRHQATMLISTAAVFIFMILTLLSIRIVSKSQKLQISNRLYNYFIQNRSRGILILDQHHRIVDANEYFCRLFDINKALILNRKADLLNDVLRSPHFSEKLSQAISGQIQESEMRLTIHNQLKRFLISATMIETVKRKCFYIVEWTDLSRITTSDRLAAWGSITQRLAHEIKNPLTTILLSLRQVQKRLVNQFKVEDEKIDDYIRSAGEEIERLRNSTNTFMKFTDAARESAAQIDVNAFIGDILKTFRHHSYINFKCRLQDDLPRIRFDEHQFRQILLQLLENSIDAIEGDGEITIATNLYERLTAPDKKIDTFVQIELTDNGAGIEEAHLESIFEPNFTTKATGSGFGLSITKFLMEQHGGAIYVKSKYGYGTTVTLNFPMDNDLNGYNESLNY